MKGKQLKKLMRIIYLIAIKAQKFNLKSKTNLKKLIK